MNWALFSPTLSLFLFTLNPLPESYWIIWSWSILCGVLTAFILTDISLHLLGTPCCPYFLDYFLSIYFFFLVNTNLGYLHFWFSSVQSFSHVQFFAAPWTAAHQPSLSITNSSLPKLMFIESVMPSNHFILCHPLLLLPSIFPSIRVFSNDSVLRIRWPWYWSFTFSISPSNEYLGLISSRMDWLDLLTYILPRT